MVGIVVAAVVLIAGIGTCVSYNGLVSKDQAVKSQWAQVENVYQRRADLVPNLVATVKGAADFEKSTLIAVTEARSRVGQLSARPEQLQEYQQAQGQLGAALSRLLVVAEAYPNLTATQNFRDLQVQLEGTENRIAVERMRFNDAARACSTPSAPASRPRWSPGCSGAASRRSSTSPRRRAPSRSPRWSSRRA